mmetsp:Transcript_29584/g.68554  ORF Transcript_29584/g.68554 Transcript_29584/m.68554 type:complete len:230 (-) Transcript_29584:91-780(-)
MKEASDRHCSTARARSRHVWETRPSAFGGIEPLGGGEYLVPIVAPDHIKHPVHCGGCAAVAARGHRRQASPLTTQRAVALDSCKCRGGVVLASKDVDLRRHPFSKKRQAGTDAAAEILRCFPDSEAADHSQCGANGQREPRLLQYFFQHKRSPPPAQIAVDRWLCDQVCRSETVPHGAELVPQLPEILDHPPMLTAELLDQRSRLPGLLAELVLAELQLLCLSKQAVQV